MKVLSNVFISTGYNKLRLADVYFSEMIKKVEPYSKTSVEWIEIDCEDKLANYKKGINNRKHSEDIVTYDGDFKLLIPGSIDSHVHFNTPGFEERDDFAHASKATLFGGVTTVFDMPCTSIPPVTSKNNFNIKKRAVNDKSFIDYFFWGGIRGEDFYDKNLIRKQISELSDCGVVGFKAYVISGMKEFSDLLYEQMKFAAECVKENNSILAVHAEDKDLVSERRNLAISEGRNDWKAYCIARDDETESKAILKLINIAKETGCRIHIVHLSSKKGLELIRKAKEKGLDITTETCPHYLYFTQNDFENVHMRNFLKTAPPVKLEQDREALWDGLRDGTISFVTTDHAGCNPAKEKKSDNFWKVYGGIPGVQHRVQFLFSEGFLKGKINLSTTIKLLTEGISDVFRLNNKGKLTHELDADFTLIDLYKRQQIKAINMYSKGKYTPFENVTFNSIIDKVFLRGEILLNEGKLVNEELIGKLQTIIH